MARRTSDWKEELGRFLRPFLARLGHKARRRMCPLYVSGLIGPGDRKSIQPMAERLGDYDQLHHFIAAGVWDAGPVEVSQSSAFARVTSSRRREIFKILDRPLRRRMVARSGREFPVAPWRAALG